MKRENVAAWMSAPAPGMPKGDRVKRKQREALEAVSRDIEQHGAITYETAELVRAALALSCIS